VFFGGGIQRMPHHAVVRNFGLAPVTTTVLGHTNVTQTELQAHLASMNARFTQATYDVFRNNCNHFSVCRLRVRVPRERETT